MGKVSKYSEELMEEAVENYAKQHSGKIFVTKLAKWSSENVEGLEGVTRKDFERKLTVKNKKDGKKELIERPAMQRVREINDLRNVTEKIKRNILLQSSRLNAFFELPGHEQRQMILDTREQVELITDKNTQLLRRNKLLQEENKLLREENDRLWQEQDMIKKRYKKIERKIDLAIRSEDEEMRRAVLATFGISNYGYSMATYKSTLKLDKEASIDDAIATISSDKALGDGFLDALMEGIDFDGA